MPEWAMTGRVPSARSSVRLMRASRIDRFQLGSSWPETNSMAVRLEATGSPGRTSRVRGSLCPHQIATDGWWPSRSTASAAWRVACLPTERA